MFAIQTQCTDKSCKIWMYFFSVGITSNSWSFPITVSSKPQIFGNCLDSRLCSILMNSSVSMFSKIVRPSSFEKNMSFFCYFARRFNTFVISTSSSALCIGHSSSRTTSKSGLSTIFFKTFHARQKTRLYAGVLPLPKF